MKKSNLKSKLINIITFGIIISVVLILLNVVNVSAKNDESLKVNLAVNSLNESAEMNLKLNIENTSSNDINLADTKVLYYFTNDLDSELNFRCNSSSIGKDIVQGMFIETNKNKNYDCYLEISFAGKSGSIKAGDTINLDVSIWSNKEGKFDIANDYSSNNSPELKESKNVPISIKNQLVLGKNLLNYIELECSTKDELKIDIDKNNNYLWEYKVENEEILKFKEKKETDTNEISLQFKAEKEGKVSLEIMGKDKSGNIKTKKVYKINIEDVPIVGSLANLKELSGIVNNTIISTNFINSGNVIQKSTEGVFAPINFIQSNENIVQSNINAAPSINLSTVTPLYTNEYSKTNIQVEGVDEADIIKTDGNYIYQISRKRVNIVDSKLLELMSFIDFEKDNFTPEEMYVNNDKLVVIGSTNLIDVKNMPKDYKNQNITKAILYDIKDRKKAKFIRELCINGNYSTSRMVGTTLYFIINKNISNYLSGGHGLLPCVFDSAYDKEFRIIGYDELRYCPGGKGTNIMSMAAMNLEDNSKSTIKSFLNAAEDVYMSAKNLYITKKNVNYYSRYPNLFRRGRILFYSSDQSTDIYKFKLENTNIEYAGRSKVPGLVLNQFSMDEYNNYFRIATTNKSVNPIVNNLYVLNEDLNTVGKLENMAPNENITATRFMGNIVYMSTNRQTDPFFVIDLKNPEKPNILGKLKIPGSYEYLHPYDENHLLGFGKDTASSYYDQGLKVSMFDVSDLENPKEKFNVVIGDRGTDSELLRNHKALLFSKEKNILSFPLSVYGLNNGSVKYIYVGAYMYEINMTDGFVFKDKITHQDGSDYDSKNDIKRIIYIGDRLFTISDGMIKANDIDSLDEISKVKF